MKKERLVLVICMLIAVNIGLSFCQDCSAKSIRKLRCDCFSVEKRDKERVAEYAHDAERYRKAANRYRRDALHHLRKARSFDRKAAYYAKRGDVSRAEAESLYAKAARENYETQMGYAEEAADKANSSWYNANRLLRRLRYMKR